MLKAIHAHAWWPTIATTVEIAVTMLLFYGIYNWWNGYAPDPIIWIVFFLLLILVDLRLWFNFASDGSN